MTTVIITCKHNKSVCSVVRGTNEQILALLAYDPQCYGFKYYRPSDWNYLGDVIDLNETLIYNACRDINKGVAKLPENARWLIR